MGFLRPKSISGVECRFQNFKNLIFFRSSPGTPYKGFLPISAIRAPAWATFTFLVFHEPSIFMRVLNASWKSESVYAFEKFRSAFAPKDKTNEICINLYWNPLCTIAKHMAHYGSYDAPYPWGHGCREPPSIGCWWGILNLAHAPLCWEVVKIYSRKRWILCCISAMYCRLGTLKAG